MRMLPLVSLVVLLLGMPLVAGQAQTWGVIARDGGGRAVAPYLSSLAGGEPAVGAVRSEPFALQADLITFSICGHCGRPGGQVIFPSAFALCDAETDLALRIAPPPRQDAMQTVTWDVVELIGRRVYFRAVDAADEPMFAWFGVGDIRIGDTPMLAGLAPGRMPDGWTEEKQPAGASREEWLALTPAGARYVTEIEDAASTWAVLTYHGGRQDCPPYLSSLVGGESGVGAVRSPEFTVDAPEYAFQGMGVDSPTGDAGLNWFQLVDARTLEILRASTPPMSNTRQPMRWDTGDLVGRRVFFRVVDGNASASWAWIGCDEVPLGEGRVARFAEPEALGGWREEGQPEGAPVGGRREWRSFEEMVRAEWALQDRRRNVRWDLWERNPAAAPWIMARLVRLMEADFERGKLLLRDQQEAGASAADARRLEARLEEVAGRFEALRGRPEAAAEWRAVRDEQRLVLREIALADPRLDFGRLLFVKRFTQQSYADINVNHHAWGSRPGGGVYTLALGQGLFDEPTVTDVLGGRLGPGNVHGLDLDFDGRRVVFAYAQSASDQPPEGWLSRQATFELHRAVGLLHLYEMGIDGGDLRQITDGQWSDLNPCYLPSGDLAFESERCGFEINCNEMDKDEPTTNLFAMGRDGSGLRRLAVTKDGDWYPRVLNDGAIIYSHWEYHERSLVYIHSLWSVLPDGTGADAYAKQHFDFPVTLTVPRPIPDSDALVAIASGHHTLAAGPIVLVDRSVGPNDPACVARVTGPDVWPEYGGAAPEPGRPGWRLPPGNGWYMDPYPLSGTVFLASYCDGPMQDERGYGLYLVDVYGGKELLYRDPAISSVMPVPVRPRQRPPVLANVRAHGAGDAVCVVTDVTEGVPELAPGEVKRLRVSEVVPWPYSNEIGGRRYEPDAKSTGVNWTPIRILGTVPVEADGSACFRVPAETELYFQALDEDGMELRRMRTYVSFQPGETRSCVGCHETRAQTPPTPARAPLALSHAPLTPEPPPWGTRALSFLRDVQPVITQHCARCHTGLKPAGGVDLSAGLTADHNRAYDTLTDPARGLLAVSSKGDNARLTQVREVGSHASRLVEVLKTSHASRVELAAEDRERLYTWIDANAVYHDQFIIKRPADAAGYSLPGDGELWTQISAIHERRCAACHGSEQLARPEWVDLDDPARSLFVAAPLAGAATSTGKKCTPGVYSPNDPDYARVTELLRAAVDRARQQPRRDLGWLVAGR